MDEGKLDKQQIVQEAMTLLREDGIAKLSMRKLAARLNIRAPTLYWYFPDRSAILRQVIIELLQGTMARVPECTTWQEWLCEFGRALWHTNRIAPFAPLLLQSGEINDRSVIAFAVDALLEQSRRFAVSRTLFLRAHSDINAYVIGYAVFWHSGATEQLSQLFDFERAVIDGVQMIVDGWSRRAGEMQRNETAA